MGRTLAEKVWNDHVVARNEGEPDLLFIDLHLVHEVTSPQAFDGLRAAGRKVRRPDLTLITEDHNIPTNNIDKPIADPISAEQVRVVRKNAEEFGLRIFSMGDAENGIVHVVGPQLGLTQPGMTVVCGDSHTSTHGAFGALAFGIGTSEVEHVLATQTLPLKPFKTMAINVNGALQPGVTAKDIILAIIAKIGTGGGQGYVLEYRGEAIRNLSMEGRMTICNMSIEAGARAGMIAPDETTFEYLKGRPHAPQGADWDAAVAYWKTLVTDADATFDAEVDLDASTLTPFVTWGTNPGQSVAVDARLPRHADADVHVLHWLTFLQAVWSAHFSGSKPVEKGWNHHARRHDPDGEQKGDGGPGDDDPYSRQSAPRRRRQKPGCRWVGNRIARLFGRRGIIEGMGAGVGNEY